MDLKSCAYRQCRILLDEQIQTLSRTLEDLKESISAETKSSAGDKHETARAHLQAAQEQAGRQLAAALAQKAALDGIDIRQTAVRISRGSLIKTSEGCLLMSVALGKMSVEGTFVTALSPQSPLGMKLMGLGVGAVAEMNGKTYVVEDIA